MVSYKNKEDLSTRGLIKKKSKFEVLIILTIKLLIETFHFIEKNGSKIICNSKIKKIKISNNRVTNILTNKNNFLSKNEKVISTIHFFASKKY